MPHDLPPWAAVYQQAQRWLAADSFAEVAGDLRAVLRMAAEREPEPSAVILDSRTLRCSPESGERAGSNGGKRKRGTKVHLTVDTPGHVVALHVDPADVDDRAQAGRCRERPRHRVGGGERRPRPSAALILSLSKDVLLPRRWVVDPSTSSGWGFVRLGHPLPTLG